MTNVAGGFALALHGGAGTLRRGEMTAAREAAYWARLWRALAAGRDVLAAGGNAVDASSGRGGVRAHGLARIERLVGQKQQAGILPQNASHSALQA